MTEPTDLVGAVHAALNATAVPRQPDPALLPPLTAGTSPLASPSRPRGDLLDVAGRRRSRYSFGAAPVAADLAALLVHGVGGSPRAGGLPSVVPYVVTRGVGVGVARADLRLPVRGLVAVRDGDPTAYVAGSLDQPEFATRVPVWLVLVADLGPSRGRYPTRHYRTVHLDAGAALQSTLLVASALGLVTCPVSGFDDAAWARLLDLPDDSFVAVLVAVGQPR